MTNRILYVTITIKEVESGMIAVNYTTLRDNMKDCFDKISDSCETMIVTRKSSNMVIMSEDSYNSLMETIYLLGNKANYSHLMKSVAQYRSGQVSQHDITED